MEDVLPLSQQLERVDFDLNVSSEGKFHIHGEGCYIMWKHNRAGLGLIIRALRPYQNVDEWGSCSVGNRHEICLVRERLQALRFETL